MQRDLTFESPDLEREFFEYHSDQNRRLEQQFQYARALTWAVVLLRALVARQWGASAIILVGTITTLLPALLDRLPRKEYLRWRVPTQVFDNCLQVALGCYTHHHIYPNPKPGSEPSTFQMATALLTGNGVAWQLFCSLWGSLPFRVALPQQAALTIMLLLFNGPLCSSSMPIQLAYARLAQRGLPRWVRAPWSLLGALQHHLLSYTGPTARSCGAAVLAAPEWAREQVRAACINATAAQEAAAAAAAAARLAAHLHAPLTGPGAAVARGAEYCAQYQPASLLLLGFLLPVTFIWRSELRLRQRFLAHKVALAGAAQQQQQQQQQQAGQQPRRQPRQRASGVQPGLMDLVSFVVPAMVAMYSFVAAR